MLIASKKRSTVALNRDAKNVRSSASFLISTAAGLACAMVTTAAAIASTSPPAVKNAVGAAMTYEQLVKVMGAAQQTDKMRARLVGKSVQLKLKKSGPSAFVVSPEDGIGFACDQRAPTFKGGPVRAQISNIEDTPEGNFLLTLQRCE
jgi:hypothetical protein